MEYDYTPGIPHGSQPPQWRCPSPTTLGAVWTFRPGGESRVTPLGLPMDAQNGDMMGICHEKIHGISWHMILWSRMEWIMAYEIMDVQKNNGIRWNILPHFLDYPHSENKDTLWICLYKVLNLIPWKYWFPCMTGHSKSIGSIYNMVYNRI